MSLSGWVCFDTVIPPGFCLMFPFCWLFFHHFPEKLQVSRRLTRQRLGRERWTELSFRFHQHILVGVQCRVKLIDMLWAVTLTVVMENKYLIHVYRIVSIWAKLSVSEEVVPSCLIQTIKPFCMILDACYLFLIWSVPNYGAMMVNSLSKNSGYFLVGLALGGWAPIRFPLVRWSQSLKNSWKLGRCSFLLAEHGDEVSFLYIFVKGCGYPTAPQQKVQMFFYKSIILCRILSFIKLYVSFRHM